MPSVPIVPVALFAYARPHHLRRTLEALRANRVPLIYAFSDGPRDATRCSCVNEVRQILRGVDWCDIRLVERQTNLGLGVSIKTGVAQVLAAHGMTLVFEDDVVPLPGAYTYLAAALRHYHADDRVMSVSAWTHDLIRPPIDEESPYFDGRFECWGWGTWARAWNGMDVTSNELLAECRRKGIDPNRYGTDIVEMAKCEAELNLWAARFALLHILRGGLCLHPPHALVENIGVGADATNTKEVGPFIQGMRSQAPAVPLVWPVPLEHSVSAELWRAQSGMAVGRTRVMVWRLRLWLRRAIHGALR